MIDGIAVIAISPKSPLGQKLIGHRNGDVIEMNGITHTIIDVL
jgi:transcription elongation GreA/GreB family factor